MNGKPSILKEFWDFLKVRKMWWLMPRFFFLIVAGLALVLTKGSALASLMGLF